MVLTEEKDFQKLVEERNIQAIVTADSKTDAESLAVFKRFDARQRLVVLRPLLLYPKEFGGEVMKMFH